MSRQRLDNLEPEKQRILFEAASREFSANGFDGASLNRILEESGMSKSSLYYYFDDKADLFTTLVERSIAILFKQIGGFDPEVLTATTFWNEFEDRYGKAIAIVNGNGWLVRLGAMFYRLRADPRRGAATNRLFLAARSWVSLIIEKGQALGVVRSDLPLSLLIESTMGLLETLDHWVVAHWQDLSLAEREALPGVHIGLFRDFLSAAGRQPV